MTVEELLSAWDRGEPIWSITMGGLGPGYEQAIQILAVEIVRDHIGKPLPLKKDAREIWGDATIKRVDGRKPDGTYGLGGLSGWQEGAAKTLAWFWLKEGPDAIDANPDLQNRRIQVTKFWPSCEKKQ